MFEKQLIVNLNRIDAQTVEKPPDAKGNMTTRSVALFNQIVLFERGDLLVADLNLNNVETRCGTGCSSGLL